MRPYSLIPILLVVALAAPAQIAVTGGAKNVSLNDIVGTSTKVTVVLKPSQALDRNLTVIEKRDDFIVVMDADGDRHVYRYSDVERIELQDGLVAERAAGVTASNRLSYANQAIVNKAFSRTRELFSALSDRQELRMRAAALMLMDQDNPSAEAKDYLDNLIQSNDLMTSLQAAQAAYVGGQTAPPTDLLERGLDSGNRRAKGLTLDLCGMMGYMDAEEEIINSVRDRVPEISAPAMRAAGRLGIRDVMPILLDSILLQNPDRAEAAVFALSQMADDRALERLKQLLERESGETMFRIARVLHAQGDPLGRRMLKERCMTVATLAPEAALLLAADGDRDAMQFLRDRLGEPYNPNQTALVYRARAAGALISGGDWNAYTILQELLTMKEQDILAVTEREEALRPRTLEDVLSRACLLIAKLENPSLLTLLQPTIESVSPAVAIAASEAAVAIANSSFEQRLVEARPPRPWSTAHMF